MKEIERKYIASVDFDLLPKPREVVVVDQGYIVANKFWEWRVRQVTFLDPETSKLGESDHTTAFKIGNGFIRTEWEWYIPRSFYNMLAKAVPRLTWIYKTRMDVNGWMIDVFHHRLTGLVLAEHELKSATDAIPPVPVGLTLKTDVTGLPEYSNKRLSRLCPDREAARLFCDQVALANHAEF